MIRPVKYLNLNSCLLNVSAFVLNELKQSGAMPLRELNETIVIRLGETAKFNFFPALNFLFLLGKVDYNEKVDAVFPTFETE